MDMMIDEALVGGERNRNEYNVKPKGFFIYFCLRQGWLSLVQACNDYFHVQHLGRDGQKT